MPLDGLDPLIQGGEVGLEGVVPDDPHGVLLRDHLVKRCGAEADLIADSRLEPRGPDKRGTGLGGLGFRFGFVEQIEEHGWIVRRSLRSRVHHHIVAAIS